MTTTSIISLLFLLSSHFFSLFSLSIKKNNINNHDIFTKTNKKN